MKRSSRKALTLTESRVAGNRQGKILKALWSCRKNAVKVSKT
jgi:hypothetical protein